MIKKFIYHYWEVFIIFLLSLTPLLWLKNGEVILGHDSGFRIDPLGYLGQVWFSWNPLIRLGSDLSNYKGFLITLLPEAVFTRLTGSLPVGQTMSFVFWFFIIGLSMYVCLKSFFSDKKYWPFRLTASVFYMYNFFLLQGWFITERAKFSLFAALPLLVVISWKTLVGKYQILQGSILFGLTLFVLNGGGSPPLYGGILVSLGVLALYFLLRAIWNKSIHDILHIIATIISCVVVTAFFNAYWLVPQAYVGLTQYASQSSAMGGFSGVLAWENVVSRYASFINLLRLQGIPDWYDNPLHPYSHFYLTSPLLVVASFLPIVAILFVLFRQDVWKQYKEHVQFFFVFLLILLVGFVMTAGSHPPLGFLYVALLRYIPGFLIFRTAFYKFGPAVWFAATVLASFAFFVLTTKYIRNRAIYVCVSILLVVGILAYHFPYFTGSFFEWNKPFSTKVVLPQYTKDMFLYMNTQYRDSNTTTMILPPLDSSFHADGYQWGFWGLDILPKLGTHVPVIANDANSPIVSALYDAATSNNAPLFGQLAGRIGVDKVLWRGDVLYADKTTTSENFRYMRDQLLQAPGIEKERESGEWTLYGLQAKPMPRDLIRAESAIYRADIDSENLRELFGSVALDASVVGGGDKEREGHIAPFVRGNILAASCVFCDSSELQQIENMFSIAYTRFLPDSPFYPFIKWKETKTLVSYAESPGPLIDVNLAFATKRLSEVWDLINRDTKDNTEALALESFAGFKQRIEDAINLSQRLGEIERNAYRARIGAYLKFYTQYLSNIDKKSILPSSYISPLYEYLSVKSRSVSDGLWITDALDVGKYYLTIPKEDTYELLVSSDRGKPSVIAVDGQNITSTDALHLQEGVHRVALKFEPDNAITAISSMSADIPLSYGQRQVFTIPKILFWDKYAIQFNYRVTKGRSIYVSFHQDNDKEDTMGNAKRIFVEALKDDGVWHSAKYVVQPNFGATHGEVVFFTADSMDEQSSVSISQLMVQNIKPANVFIVKHNSITRQETPNISYLTINPAVYVATVSDAQRPFIFRFGQSFDPGWKAFIIPKGQGVRYKNFWQLSTLFFYSSINAKEHFVLDSLVNGWYMDTTGSYDVMLVYWPYIIFLISFVSTCISVTIGLMIMGKRHFRR